MHSRMALLPVCSPSHIPSLCRWCKGGMQVWFSKHNPWLNKNLKLSHKILWSNGPWSYMTGLPCHDQSTRPFHLTAGAPTLQSIL